MKKPSIVLDRMEQAISSKNQIVECVICTRQFVLHNGDHATRVCPVCAADGLEPDDDDDPPCDCKERDCDRNPCKGQCGCEACRRSYMDFLSCE